MPSQVDYAALANQARQGGSAAAPDYAALARQPVAATAPAAPSMLVAAGGRGTRLDVRKSDDFASGIGAGAASTVYHGGDLIRRATGMERVIDRPEVQAAITPPNTVPGKVGFYGERSAEFLAPVTRVAKLTKALPWFGRTMAEAGTGAAVAGVQTGGDPAAMITTAGLSVAAPLVVSGGRATVNTVREGATRAATAIREAAAGASEGGVGGAVASVVRSTVPASSRVMLTQALKPRAGNVNWGTSVERAFPDLKMAELGLGRSVETIEDLQATVRLAKSQNRTQYNAVAGPLREQGTTVDLTPVADKVVATIPRKVQLTSPDKALAIQKATDVYRQRFSLQDAEALLQDTNAELEAYYAQFPHAQHAALRSRPEVAQLVAEADALRTAIYSTLDAGGETGAARELQRRYGALLDIEHEATRRANVAARQQPVSLAEQIATASALADRAAGIYRMGRGVATGSVTDVVGGGADIVRGQVRREVATALKEQQTTNALIKRAFANYRGQPMPAHAPAAATTAPAASARSAAR